MFSNDFFSVKPDIERFIKLKTKIADSAIDLIYFIQYSKTMS